MHTQIEHARARTLPPRWMPWPGTGGQRRKRRAKVAESRSHRQPPCPAPPEDRRHRHRPEYQCQRSIGTSSDSCDLAAEIRKARLPRKRRRHRDELSVCGDLDRSAGRSRPAPPAVGKSPLSGLQETAPDTRIRQTRPEFLFELIEANRPMVLTSCIHSGINRYTNERCANRAFATAAWPPRRHLMVAWNGRHGRENPLYEQFDRVCGLMSGTTPSSAWQRHRARASTTVTTGPRRR
jgi:hypothetical protein